MRKLKYLGWCAGWLVVMGAIAAPASAQNQSDTSGTNVFNDTTIRFGFQPFSAFEERLAVLLSALEATDNTVVALLSNEAISAETRVALEDFAARLQETEQDLWASQRQKYSQSLEEAVELLLVDFDQLSASCQAGDSTDCLRLANLIADLEPFLDALADYRAALQEYAQVARIF